MRPGLRMSSCVRTATAAGDWLSFVSIFETVVISILTRSSMLKSAGRNSVSFLVTPAFREAVTPTVSMTARQRHIRTARRPPLRRFPLFIVCLNVCGLTLLLFLLIGWFACGLHQKVPCVLAPKPKLPKPGQIVRCP